MRRLFPGLLTCLVVWWTAASPVRACINDREVERSERQFKSDYRGTEDEPSTEENSPNKDDLPVNMASAGVAGLGSVMLVAAITLGLVRRRPVRTVDGEKGQIER
jgi:hypothetical protein